MTDTQDNATCPKCGKYNAMLLDFYSPIGVHRFKCRDCGHMLENKKCDYMKRAKSFAEREVGCPLDHCPCGTHNVDHDCPEVEEDPMGSLED